MHRLTITAATLLALTSAAGAQSYSGDYTLSGAFADGVRTRATLSVRVVGGQVQLDRQTTTPTPARWTAISPIPAPGEALRTIYRTAPAAGIVGAISGATPAPDNLFLATYRVEQGQLREAIVNFTRRGGDQWLRLDTVERKPLPTRIRNVLDQVLAIASANTTNKDTIPAVRAQLNPLIDELGRYYAANRPVDEPALTRGAWKSLWYDDPDIEAGERFGPLDRENIYQVIYDGFYYNVSNTTTRVFGINLFKSHSYLKGLYTIADPSSAATAGQPRRNVIDLTFDANRLRVGRIPTDRRLVDLVRDVDTRRRRTIPVPGPRGITGELWNVYLDEDVRISLGVQDTNGTEDVYILRRTEKAGPLP